MNKLYIAIVLSVFLAGCETTRSPLEPDDIKASIQAELDRAKTQEQRWVVPDDVNAELIDDDEQILELENKLKDLDIELRSDTTVSFAKKLEERQSKLKKEIVRLRKKRNIKR